LGVPVVIVVGFGVLGGGLVGGVVAGTAVVGDADAVLGADGTVLSGAAWPIVVWDELLCDR
jgi:hypothetical protein